jgi:AcrR family transcriptional regulator
MLNVFNRSSPKSQEVVSRASGFRPKDSRGGEKMTAAKRRKSKSSTLRFGLFREHGFDETTMRGIASEAGVALGLAYHYFPSKEALVMAYYERVQREHHIVAHEQLGHTHSLRDRLAMPFETKLDILKDDRNCWERCSVTRETPDHPLSFLGKATVPLRADCMSLFAEALAPERLPDDLRKLLPLALWALHMGVLLYFLYDRSPNLKQTRKLVNGSVDLTASFLKLAKFPLLRPVRRGVMGLLRDAGLKQPT